MKFIDECLNEMNFEITKEVVKMNRTIKLLILGELFTLYLINRKKLIKKEDNL